VSSHEELPRGDEAALRAALASRLHDGVQQTLTVACMELSQAVAPSGSTQDSVVRSLAHVRAAFDEIGDLVEELRTGL
jgi:signal transduction histidine kinase